MEKIKKEFRRNMRQQLAHFFSVTSPEQRAEMAALLWAQVEAHPAFVAASRVLLYSALPDEVPTQDFLSRWYEKKEIYLPMVDGENLRIKRYDPAAVRSGYCAVLEPLDECEEVAPQAIEFAVIPGLAFDKQGGRMGRGKGYYDRLLPLLSAACKVSVAFPAQLCEKVPTESFDVPVDCVFLLPLP